MQSNRLWFLQAARGIACFLIVYVHWIGLIGNPNVIKAYVYQNPIQNYVSPDIVSLIATSFGYFL